MIEKYLTLELVFLVPLLLAVAIPICRRRAPTELRFRGLRSALPLASSSGTSRSRGWASKQDSLRSHFS
jgi:hypothetical protein